jgi:hypothetical protein
MLSCLEKTRIMNKPNVMMGKEIVTSLHLIPLRVPNSQKINACNDSPKVIMMNEMTADKKLVIAIPASNTVSIGTLGPVLAILYTTKTVTRAPIKAISCIESNMPKKLNPIPRPIAIAAPKAAPEEIPSR